MSNGWKNVVRWSSNRRSNERMDLTHLCILQYVQCHTLLMLMADERTNSSAAITGARPHQFNIILISRMLNRLATSTSTLVHAGVMKSWGLQMMYIVPQMPGRISSFHTYKTEQSLPHFNRRGKEKSPTHISNTQRLKQSKFLSITTLWMWLMTNTQKVEIVWWVSESLQPFEIVKDCGFECLMKTGRPKYYIPSPSTVLCNVRLVFAQTCKHIAKMLWVGLFHHYKEENLTCW